MNSDSIDPKAAFESSMTFTSQKEVDHLKALAEEGSKNLEKVAAKFESIFLGFLIKQMWETMDRSGLLSEGPGKQVYDGLITTMLADHLAQNGGIGIAKAMVTQLKNAAEAYQRQQDQTGETLGSKTGIEPEGEEVSS